MEKRIFKIYETLYKTYGPQGWWPFLNEKGESVYHKGDYSFPHNDLEIFEVCLGSILTQNTTFASVVKSLDNLKSQDALSVDTIKTMDINSLKEAIRPSGYFNQKSRYILAFIAFYETLKGRIPSREELLSVVGIGEETADSILLYGYKQLEYKVDAYTKRVMVHLGLINEKARYKDIKVFIEKALEAMVNDKKERLRVYQEFHALIVCHAKSHYSKKPYGANCFLKDKI